MLADYFRLHRSEVTTRPKLTDKSIRYITWILQFTISNSSKLKITYSDAPKFACN